MRLVATLAFVLSLNTGCDSKGVSPVACQQASDCPSGMCLNNQCLPPTDLSAGDDMADMATLDDLLVPGDMAPMAPDLAPVILGRDTFQRPNSPNWGTASDGQQWGGEANSSLITAIFDIQNNNGVIDNNGGAVGGPGFALLGPLANDMEVFATGAVSKFSAQIDLVVLARNTSPTTGPLDYYRAGIDGTNLFIDKELASTLTPIASTAFAASDNTSYSIRFRVMGTTLSAKVWDASGTEPSNWMLTTTDSSHADGNAGVGIWFHTSPVLDLTGKFSYFEARKL